MLYVKPRSWDSIVDGYEELVEKHNWPFEPMRDLVRQIAVSRYVLQPPVTVLYPATSLADLFIGITEPFMWKTDVLGISYNSKTQIFNFEFWESPYIKQRWTRKADPSNAFAVFERFMVLKGWA